MFYKRVQIKLSERSLMKMLFGVPYPQTREISHDVKLLDAALEKLKKGDVFESENVSKHIILELNESPIYKLHVGEVLELNKYRIIVDGNDNMLIYAENPDDKSYAKTIQELVFLYESKDFFNGSKMMLNFINEIEAINKDLEQFLSSISQESKFLLRAILKDEYKLDNLKKRNNV